MHKEIGPYDEEIDINKKSEIAFWSERLNVNPIQLRTAFIAAGPSAEDVCAYLLGMLTVRSPI